MEAALSSNKARGLERPDDRIGPLEVSIPTATAIVRSKDDPLLVLIGDSKKHSRPVLPGGKLEARDMRGTSILDCAAGCLARELEEEIGISGAELRHFEVRSDPQADIRAVTAGSLRGTLADDLVKDLRDGEQVFGRYGVPDYVFVTSVDPASVGDTEELSNLRWVDCRKIAAESLGGGHGAVLMRYAAALASI